MQEKSIDLFNDLEMKKTMSFRIYEVIKRVFDFICSLLGLVIASPLFIIISILIKLDSKGDIFIKQKRIGLKGEEFVFYKFRTMYSNSEEVLKEILATDPVMAKEYAINKKFANDPRITRIGKFLRKSSLDELPQLINVLKNDMSIIGNRPYMPREKEDMGLYFNIIVSTKPGITGYWQTNGRSNVTFAKRLELEQYYSLNRSMKLDIKILFKTFTTIFKKGSAK